MAITANELRIGNWVYDGNNELTQVHSIVDGAINYELDYGNLWTNKECYFENINPIPLNEEWLLKFGFEKVGLYYHFTNSYFKLEQYKNKNAFWLRSGTEHLDCVRINYVHQLQNLYFTLTGKELTYGNNPD